jgi:hypothetical protein
MTLETDLLYPEFDVAQSWAFSLTSFDASCLDSDIFADFAFPNCASGDNAEHDSDSTETLTQPSTRSTSTTAVHPYVSVVPILPAAKPPLSVAQWREAPNASYSGSTKRSRKQGKILLGNNRFGRAGCLRCIQCRLWNKKVTPLI